jgi:hypothetical protein
MEPPQLSPTHERALARAVTILEGKSFVGRMTEITGEPLYQLLSHLPGPVTRGINRAVRATLAKSLDLALNRMGPIGRREPRPAIYQLASGLTGGVSGFFGVSALAIELPVTTTLMLRSIAGIAARYGERLERPEARLACIEVLALGPHGKDGAPGETTYLASRALLAKTVSDITQNLLERGAATSTGPLIVDLITSIASRFGVAVSERVAASAIPVVGALGGAAINLAFMQHFQRIARAHFAVRSLERIYGGPMIRAGYHRYDQLSRESPQSDRVIVM